MKKLFLAFAAMLMAFSVSAAELNIYASGLKAGAVKDGKVEISYLLNAPATALELQLFTADTVAKTIALTDSAALLTKGAHTYTLDLAGLELGGYSWAIKASAAATEAITEVTDVEKGIYNFYLPQGLAVDASPESAFFGRIYVTEGWGGKGQGDGGSDRANATTDGVFIYDALLEDVTTQGTTGYAGGITWSSKRYGPARVAVADNGEVFIVDYADATSAGVYKMNPAAPADPFKVVVTPATDTNYVDPNGIAIEGVGAERVLYMLQPGEAGTITARVIGDAETPFAGTPDTLVDFTGKNIVNYDGSLATDGRGGFWGAQNRAQLDVYPALYHFNAKGELDFAVRSGDDYAADAAAVGGTAWARGTMALNADKTLLAHGQNGIAVVFSIAYDATTGKPSLTKLYETPALGNNVDGLAFDYAGNLYAVSASKERLYAFATPKAENTCVTSAPKSEMIVLAPAEEQFNVYAYDLSSTFADGQLTVKYSLNAWAQAVTLLVFDADGKEVAAHNLGGKVAGSYEATISTAELPIATYTWAIKAEGGARADITAELLNMKNGTYWQPRDIAINQNPESPFFGQMYMSNSQSGGTVETGYIGTEKAIYVFNPVMEAQGTYYGGIAWEGNNGPYRLYIDKDDKVFVSHRSTTAGGLYIMDPANPTADFKPFFANGTGLAITGFDFAGEGAERELMIADGVTYGDGYVVKYTVGEAKENFAGIGDTIGAATSDLYLGNQHLQIAHDGRGGWFICQNRGTQTSDLHSLCHINAEGVRDWDSWNTSIGLSGSPAGALAISKDYKLLACAADQGIAVYEISWAEDGKPILTQKHKVAIANNMNGVEFDYAGNLWTGSSTKERLYAYALPSENIATTPAASQYAFEALPVGTYKISLTVDSLVAAQNLTVSEGNNATCYPTLKLNDVVTISTSGEPNCGAIYGNAPGRQWRLYQAKKGDVTVTVAKGYELKSVKFTYKSDKNGILSDEVASDATISVTGDSVTYTVVNSGDATNGQVRITAFEIVYAELPVAEPTELFLTPNWGEIEAGGAPFEITAGFDIELTDEQLVEGLKWTSSITEGVQIMGVNPIYVTVGAEVPAGQLMITATYGELEMTGYYTILPAGPQGISITPNTDLKIESLDSLQLTAALYPEDAEATVVWSSSDETLATVSATGLVKSLVTEKDTVVSITAKAEGFEGIEATVEITLLAANTALDYVGIESNVVKVIENGQIYIIRNEEKFTVTGIKVE